MTISQILGSIKFARMHQKNIVTLFFHKFCAIYIHQFLYKFIIFPFENPMYEIMNSLSVYLSIYTSFLTKKKKKQKRKALNILYSDTANRLVSICRSRQVFFSL